ncbi:hypothetical protein GEMRC1_001809 [Eukaryota sp. GEM-RC1]
MEDLAYHKKGAAIFWVTAEDPEYPALNIIDGDNRSCFCTTGLFPQEIIIALPRRAKISKLRTLTLGVKEYQILYSNDEEPVQWSVATTVTLAPKDRPVTESSSVALEACFLKLVILSGYNHFVKIHRVFCEGK